MTAAPTLGEPRIRTTATGLRLVATPCHSGLATIAITVPSGSLHETDGTPAGTAALLARMLTHGTRRHPTAEALAMHVETLGGVYSAGSEHDLTTIAASVPVSELQAGLAASVEVATEPLLAEAPMRVERRRLAGQLRGAAAVPATRASDLADRLLYPDSPEGRTSAELARVVPRLQRADLSALHARQFRPASSALAVATPGPLDQALDWAEQFTAEWTGGSAAPATAPALGTRRLDTAAMPADLAYLSLVAPAVPRGHADTDALNLLAVVLGGGATSRLFVEVREKRGLCYGIGCRLAAHSMAGMVRIDAGVPADRLAEAMQAIVEQVEAVAIDATAEEVDKARALLLGHLAMESDRPETWARRFSRDLVQLGRLRTHAEIVASFEAVDAKRVQSVAARYLAASTLRLSVAGPNVQRAAVRKLVPG